MSWSEERSVSDEHYGKILHSFWTDPRIKRRLSRDAKLLLCYYFSSPHKNMAGLYHCPIAYVADETGLEADAVRAGLQVIKDWVTFDPDTDEVFVHGLAETAIGTDLKAGDTKRKTLERYLQAAHSPRLLHLFAQRYGAWGLRIPLPEQRATPSDTPSDTPSHTPSYTRAVEVAVAGEEQEQKKQTATPSAADAASNGDRRTEHNLRSTLMAWIEHLYFGKRPPEDRLRRVGSVLKALHETKNWSYDDLARMAEGLAKLRAEGKLQGVGIRDPVDPHWLHTAKGEVDPCQRALDAYYDTGKPKAGKSFGVTDIQSILGRGAA
jgi:hypothetical protein